MNYRGYLIARTPPELTDSAYPWAYGRVGSGITGWARTRADAKRCVDRDIAHIEEQRASDSEMQASLQAALSRLPARPVTPHNPALCAQCAEEAYR